MKRLITALVVAIAMLVSFNVTAETAEANGKQTTTRSSSPTWE